MTRAVTQHSFCDPKKILQVKDHEIYIDGVVLSLDSIVFGYILWRRFLSVNLFSFSRNKISIYLSLDAIIIITSLINRVLCDRVKIEPSSLDNFAIQTDLLTLK